MNIEKKEQYKECYKKVLNLKIITKTISYHQSLLTKNKIDLIDSWYALINYYEEKIKNMISDPLTIETYQMIYEELIDQASNFGLWYYYQSLCHKIEQELTPREIAMLKKEVLEQLRKEQQIIKK